MFCSHCGKTLDSGTDRCPHCGAPLGESRLSGHTSVQPRFAPDGDASTQPARYAPYTKTTYTGEMDAGEDVYSRTAYRPVLAEEAKQPRAEQTSDETGARQDGAEHTDDAQADVDAILRGKPVQLDEAQKVALKRLEAVPEDAPDPEAAQKIVREQTGVQVSALKPVRKKGISPEVESYIQRMEAMKGKKSRKKASRDEEVEQEQSVSAMQEAPVPDEEDAPEVAQAPRAPRERRGARRWIGRIAAILLIVVVIGGGLVYLAYTTQPKAPIDGVTAELFDSGVALMKDRMSDSYRKEIIALFKTDTAAQSVQARHEADRAQINALMPAKPRENDQTFINTLLSIQDAVDAATATDGLAALTASDASLDLSAASQEQWAIIDNYVRRLESATKLSDLDIVSAGVQDVMATPEPTPTPEVSQYVTLSKGSKSQKVKDLQERLRELGWFLGNVDGQYGTITQTAIKQFQQAAGLTTDGIATAELQELIFSDSAPVKGNNDAASSITDGLSAAPTPAQ